MKTKTYNTKEQAKWKFIFAISMIVLATVMEISGYGNTNVGGLYLTAWFYTIGAISLVIAVKNHFYGGEIKYDERVQMLILKASRFTFSWLIYVGLVLMVVATINPMKVDLMTMSSFMLFSVIIVYKLYYWRISKKY